MKRLKELEHRFEHTGRENIKYLDDSELKELHSLYLEVIEYFKGSNDIISFYFLMKDQCVINCLIARGIYDY